MSATFVMLGDATDLLTPPGRDTNLMAVLLILVLAVALVLCLVTLVIVLHFLRASRLASQRELKGPPLLPLARRFHSQLFGIPARPGQ